MSVTYVQRKRYGFWRFCFDFVFGVLTGGLWWVYLIFRALHNR